MNGTALCYENICSDPGYRNPIFVSIYVGVPQSNCHPKRCPFGATTVCINSPVQIYSNAIFLTPGELYSYLRNYTLTDYITIQKNKIYKLQNSTLRVAQKLNTSTQKLIVEKIDVATTNISFTGCLVEFEEEFQNDVVGLPNDNSTLQAPILYGAFIKKYGTSYVNRIVLGGRA